jgi:uncharacterized SAM-binding protein YcdF (DUF218 family)
MRFDDKYDEKQFLYHKQHRKRILYLSCMFFILSKTLNFLLSPFNWLLLLLLWFLLTKKKERKKKLGIVLVSLFLLFSNPFIIHKILLAWQYPMKEMKTDERHETGILLAGFVGFETKTKQGYYGGASDRFIQAVRLYKLGHIKKILVTGGSGSIWRQQYKEADFVKEQLLQMGVDDAAIIIDNQSRNTYENATNTKHLLDSLKIKPPYLLITSSMHMRRSLKVFQKQGIDPVPFPCNFRAIPNPQTFSEIIFPSIRAFDDWDAFLKEAAGLLIYKLTGKA